MSKRFSEFTACSITCLIAISVTADLQAQSKKGFVRENVSSTNYYGELVGITNNAISLKIKDQNQTVALVKPLNKTRLNVNGKTTLDVLRKGMTLRVEGKLDLQNFYQITDSKINIVMHSELRQSSVDKNGKLLLMAKISSTNPLRVRGIPTYMLSAETLPNGSRHQFPVKGREFQLTLKKTETIPIEFGNKLKLAGDSPGVYITIPKLNGTAQSVTLSRKGILTATDLGLR